MSEGGREVREGGGEGGREGGEQGGREGGREGGERGMQLYGIEPILETL